MFRKSILIITTILLCSHAFAFEAKYEYPKAFIENKAQFDGRNKLTGTKILYAIDHGPFQVYFTATGMTYRFDKKLPKQKWDKTKPINSQEEWEAILAKRKAVRMESTLYHIDFANANPAVELVASEPLQEYFSYGMGSNSLHYNFIKGYKQLTYKNLYPGIDLEFTFHPEKGFKYQFVVKPGADPNMIALVYNGDAPPRMDGQGNILLTTPYGDAKDHAPISFLGKEKKSIATSFQMIGNKITFALSPYDSKKQLVIDPWVVFPPSPNSNKVWEVETDNSGNVYAYMGDSPFYLRKYNSAGSLQWSYSSSWDSSGFWVGGMVTHPNGDTYITTGSNGEIRKISPNGSLVWYNNPNGLTSYEYWSLAFNCDLTQLVVGGSRATFSIPFPVIRGTMMNINLANGAIANTTVVGFGNITGIPPRIQEASSICSSPNGNYYFLTLDTIGSINNSLSTVGFKIPTSYNFDYYIPGYGFGTKQPISATRANGSALYTHDGQTLHKRDLLTGAILATASIPSGIINTLPIFGTKTQGNGGLDLDNCGNVYVGSGNGVYKFDSSLNLIASAFTSGAVYDVDVATNGEVAASGVNFVATVNLSACPVMTYVCGNPVNATTTATAVSCVGNCDGTATVTAIGGTAPYTYAWNTGVSATTVNGLCAGNYTVTVTDAAGTSSVQSVTVGSPTPLVANASALNQITCTGANNGSVVVSVSGGAGQITYSWNTTPPQSGTSINNLSPGTYVLTVTDTSGCQDTLSVTIIDPAPIVLQSSSTPSTCNQSSGTATVVASGGTGAYTYDWNSIPAQSTATAIGLAAGSYSVTVTDANGCTSQTQVTVQGLNAPTAVANSQPACGSNSGSASVTVNGGASPYSYSWSPGGANTSSINGVAAGAYQCIVTDANGCSVTVLINILANPLPTLLASTQPACGDGNGNASIVASGGTAPYAYQWNPGGSTTASISNITAGSYQCTVTDANGCSQTASVNVVTYALPVVNAGTDVSVISGQSITLTASGGISYNWTPAAGLSCDTCQITIASPFVTTTYCVTVTDANGCTGSDCMTLTVDEPCGDVFIPSAFSPDAVNDPENDRFCVYGRCIATLSLSVFDRWGKLVFETSDKLGCWDGTYKGKALNTGVYMYVAKVSLSNGENKVLKGDVSLIR